MPSFLKRIVPLVAASTLVGVTFYLLGAVATSVMPAITPVVTAAIGFIGAFAVGFNSAFDEQ